MLLVAPEIILQLTDLLENETNNIQFVCQAIGVPVPYIRWYFNGVMVNLSDSSKYNISSIYLNDSIIESTLNIINAESSDVGAYTCEAENIFGTDQSSGVLTVDGKYACIHAVCMIVIVIVSSSHCYDTITDAAEILEPLVDITEYIEEGENITLRCIGVGHPPPLVQWRKLNGSLSDRVSSTNMSMSTNEGNITRVTVHLLITKVSREDTGVYECSASNLLNIATRNISLIVQCMLFIL